MNPRELVAIAAGRIAGAASRALGRGGGTAIAGLVAQQLDRELPRRLASTLGHGSTLVTGTNGKTTTARMLAAAAHEAGLRPLANPSGSNLMRGVTAALIAETGALGGVRDAAHRLGVFEVDEASLPEAARQLAPRAIVFTNLFRDQLDRYGEVDTVAGRWRETIAAFATSGGPEHQPSTPVSDTSRPTTRDPRPGVPLGAPTLVLNADDPAVASLARHATGPVLTYGVDDTRHAVERIEHASDYRFCLSCGAELSYSAAFYGHVGHWRCPSCGNARPTPAVRATWIEFSERATQLAVDTPAGDLRVLLPLEGLYNACNALAAIAGALALGLPVDAVERALAGFRAAFGRQEWFDVDGRRVEVLLGKNPTGMNQVLRLVAGRPGPKQLLLFLNDGIADGRDVSWIWDTDYELLAGQAAAVVVAGTRAEELALRLKYAGLDATAPVVHDARAALDRALAQTAAGETLYVVPTYTAMLKVRELLARRGGRGRFWEDA